ncbi:MAG: YicC/YloC family endoribonuclease [Chthoniobacterales bacterium]
MISMSGFGSGTAQGDGRRYRVECASVNRKGLDIAITLPRRLTSLEPKVREEVQKKFNRGRIHVSVTEEISASAQKKFPVLDHNAASSALQELQRLQRSLKLTGTITIETVLKVPGVLQDGFIEQIDVVAAWKPLQAALHKALQSLLAMRIKEGKNLVVDLRKRIALLEQIAEKIQTRVPSFFQNRHDQIRARFAEWSIPISTEDPSLLRELAFFVERSDVNEEVIRLKSHLLQCRELLTKRGEARTFDYLAQEMFREFNTLTNKANDAEISRWVVQAKSELDKIREQLANLE